jgi:hypothetical protein
MSIFSIYIYQSEYIFCELENFFFQFPNLVDKYIYKEQQFKNIV